MSKKDKAQQIYNEMLAAGTLTRKAFIERMIGENGMSAGGGSTYYVNCKNVAEGKVAPTTPKAPKAAIAAVDGAKPAAITPKKGEPSWSIVIANNLEYTNGRVTAGTVAEAHSFPSSEKAVARYDRLKPEGQGRCVVVAGSPRLGDQVASLEIIHSKPAV